MDKNTAAGIIANANMSTYDIAESIYRATVEGVSGANQNDGMGFILSAIAELWNIRGTIENSFDRTKITGRYKDMGVTHGMIMSAVEKYPQGINDSFPLFDELICLNEFLGNNQTGDDSCYVTPYELIRSMNEKTSGVDVWNSAHPESPIEQEDIYTNGEFEKLFNTARQQTSYIDDTDTAWQQPSYMDDTDTAQQQPSYIDDIDTARQQPSYIDDIDTTPQQFSQDNNSGKTKKSIGDRIWILAIVVALILCKYVFNLGWIVSIIFSILIGFAILLLFDDNKNSDKTKKSFGDRIWLLAIVVALILCKYVFNLGWIVSIIISILIGFAIMSLFD